MRITTNVTPYESVTTSSPTSGKELAYCLGGLAAAGIAIAGWLCEETDREKAFSEGERTRLPEQVKWDKALVRSDSNTSVRTPLSQIALKIRKALLVDAAISLGFLPATFIHSVKLACRRPFVLLESPIAERVAITKSANQRVTIHTWRPNVASRIVKQHSIRCLANYFNTHGMCSNSVQLANHVIEILANGAMSPQGFPIVRTQVNCKGELAIDVHCLNQAYRKRLVAGIAEAVGGEVSFEPFND